MKDVQWPGVAVVEWIHEPVLLKKYSPFTIVILIFVFQGKGDEDNQIFLIYYQVADIKK